MQTDSTTSAALAATVSRLGWCEALSAALGSGYRVVWRDAGDAARVTLTMSGTLPISEQRVHISAQPASVSCSSGTPTKTLLESADGTRWALLERMVPLVDGSGSPLAPVTGAGFRWVDPLVVQPPVHLSALPAWLQDAPLMTWVPVSSSLMTNTGSNREITSYSGATMRGAQMLVFGGGHNDYYGNEVLGLDLLSDDPQWSIVGAGSPPHLWEPAVYYYADGKPSSRHTYWTLHWIEEHGRMFALGGTTAYSSAYVTSLYADAFDPVTGQWDAGAGASWPNVLSGNSGKASVFDGTRIWEFSGSTGRLYRCDVPTMAWTDCGDLPGSHYSNVCVLYDPARNRLIRPYRGPSDIGPRYFSLDGYTGGIPSSTNFSFSGADQPPTDWGEVQMVYCPYLAATGKDAYLCVKHQDSQMRVWAVDPDTFAVTRLTISGAAPSWPSPADAKQNYYGRFSYVPALKGVVWAYAADRNVQFIRTE